MNLTAVRSEEEIVTRHFGESLFLARHLFPVRQGEAMKVPATDERPPTSHKSFTTLADIGSGPGFPGIPIKLWAPQSHVTLIESQHKKATFLREVTRALALTDVEVVAGRAEDVKQSFDIVTLRAVERFTQILPVAARLVADTGRLALLIGTQQLPQGKAILSEWAWSPEIAMPESNSRCLSIAAREPS